MDATDQLNDLVIRYGLKMNDREYDECLDLWARAAKGESLGLKLKLFKARIEDQYPISPSRGMRKAAQPQKKLTGFQLAAVRCGLDPATPGLAQMSVTQMRELAAEQLSAQNAEFVKERETMKKTPPSDAKKSSTYRGLTGPQMAARKVGLDINTPGLEGMTLAEMKALSEKQIRDRIEPLARANSRFRRDGLDWHGR